MCYVLRKGTTGRSILVEARSVVDSAPVRGLKHDSPGACAAYLREGAAQIERLELMAGALGVYGAGALVEVDRSVMPGIYQLGVPDAVFAAGADSALIVLSFPGVRVDPVEISLVAYDPQDDQRLGMAAIGPEGRIAALRGAFPRLTARELVEDGRSRDS